MKNIKVFLTLVFMMGLVVIVSNYLVQFPVNLFGFNEILTYGAFSYPIAFLITDLTNRKFGKIIAKKIVYIGFVVGIAISIFLSFTEINLISLRIAIGSGVAFLCAQLLDVNIFDMLRHKSWYLPPLVSSFFSSIIDTGLFFFIAFYGTNVNWITLAFGDLSVKLIVALVMLIPFRILMSIFTDNSKKKVFFNAN